ncbi:MAG: hypothetical protein IPH69_16735 [Bacteroidales bacterium]|nr:hypothetical protein [Bacteroidales bacterium]
MAGRVVALVLGLVLIGCRGGQKELAGKGIVTELSVDSTLIFNGKDLDGWEITNFGPQGPVYISGDAIILGMGEGCTGVTYRKISRDEL